MDKRLVSRFSSSVIPHGQVLVFILEDLFVRKEFRGYGVGKMLLAQLAEIAREEGLHTIKLDVLDWNESAIKFYKSLGADYLPQWRNVIFGEEALVRLGRS
jgi:GNAT superfamily N-acetyltransferase